MLVEESRPPPSSDDQVVAGEAPKGNTESEPKNTEEYPRQPSQEVHKGSAESVNSCADSQDTTVFVFDGPDNLLGLDNGDKKRGDNMQTELVSVLEEMD